MQTETATSRQRQNVGQDKQTACEARISRWRTSERNGDIGMWCMDIDAKETKGDISREEQRDRKTKKTDGMRQKTNKRN